MNQLTWQQTIIQIEEEEKQKKKVLDSWEVEVKNEIEKNSESPCFYLKDLLTKIWQDQSIHEHYKKEMSIIIEKLLKEIKCN